MVVYVPVQIACGLEVTFCFPVQRKIRSSLCGCRYGPTDNLHHSLNFSLDNKNEIPRKYLLKVVKFQNVVKKCCNVWKI